jgi:hypothetical protein
MKKEFLYTYIILILLTGTVAFLASVTIISKEMIFLIMGISAIKFLLVSFQFMELKKANSFWKVVVLLFWVCFLLILVSI